MAFTLVHLAGEPDRLLPCVVCDACGASAGSVGFVLFGSPLEAHPAVTAAEGDVATVRVACGVDCRDFTLALKEPEDALGYAPLAAYARSLFTCEGPIPVTHVPPDARPRLVQTAPGHWAGVSADAAGPAV
jgi:hypothetical protein